MWHVSVSLTDPAGRPLSAPGRLERTATTLLSPVGGDTEWWHYNRRARIGHLRVAVTDGEHASMPYGCAVHDAGQAGPPRTRTPAPRR